MRRLRVLATVVLVSLVAIGERARSQTSAPDISIGVVRSDGTLLPIASRRKGAWQPALQPDTNTFRLKLATPMQPTGWRMRSAAGLPAPLTLGRLVTSAYECGTAQGLAIQGYAGPRPRGGERVLNVGIAAAGTTAIEIPQDVRTLPDDSSRRVAAFITTTVNAAEPALVNARNWLQSREPRSGARVFAFERFYRHTTDLVDWYYFEGTKPYSLEADIFISGWIHTSGSELTLWRVHTAVAGTDPTLRGSPTEALGVARVEGSNLWLLAFYTNIDEIYGVFDAYDGGNGTELRSVLEVGVSHCNP